MTGYPSYIYETIWQALSKPPHRRQGPDLRPLWLLVGTPSAIRPELAFSRAEHSLPYSDVTIYIFAISYFYLCSTCIDFMTSPLGVAVGFFLRSYSELLSKFGTIPFQDYASQVITHPVFYGDLVYKLWRIKGEANFISSGSEIVKRLRRRQYDPAIIERTIGIVIGPLTALYRSFLKRCTLTNKAVGTIWRALSKPPQRRQGPDPRPLWLLVGTPSAFGPDFAYRMHVAQPTLMDVTRYFWYTFILLYMFVCHIVMTSPLWSAVGPQST